MNATHEQKQILKLKSALAKCRAEASKNKPNPDVIYNISNDALLGHMQEVAAE